MEINKDRRSISGIYHQVYERQDFSSETCGGNDRFRVHAVRDGKLNVPGPSRGGEMTF